MSSTSFTAEAGRTQFLQLFVKQLQHQDPLEPVKQEEFLQQLAQFSTVEGLENLNGKIDQLVKLQEASQNAATLQALNTGAGLIGRTVTHGADGSSRGVVTEVQQKSGQVLLRVGDALIPVADVSSITQTPADAFLN